MKQLMARLATIRLMVQPALAQQCKVLDPELQRSY